jgi:ParB family transcriptional regulator, chromosome partitioning protein
MNAKKRGLGIGLGELLSSVSNITKPESTIAKNPYASPASGHNVGSTKNADDAVSTNKLSSPRKLDIDLMHPNKYQPRQEFDSTSLNELAESIKVHGIIQPILVRPGSNGEYEIVAGERRWRAAQIAGINEVPVIVRELSNEQTAAIALIENLQREDLNAIDTALGLQRLINDFGLTHQAAAESVGKSRAAVSNLLRLLSLPDTIKNMVQKGIIEMGHARALLALPPHQQIATANRVVAKKMSVRATEELIQNMQYAATKNGSKGLKIAGKLDPNIASLQNKLRDTLGAKTQIKHTNKGSGKVIIHYSTLNQLDGILERIIAA